MVFCNKLITESPRRSGSVSPRKASPTGRLPDVTSSISQLISTLDYEAFDSSLLEDIPEREWRLLATLARKRDRDIQREKLADEFHRMWQKEKEERDLVAAETSEQYKRYVQRKRERDRVMHEFKSYQRCTEEQMKQGILLHSIKHKERRSAELLAFKQDMKVNELVGKAIEDEARAMLAADRRSQLSAAEEWKRKAELVDGMKRVDDARRRRNAMLRDTSQRVAIANALSRWESTLLKQEVTVMDEYKRAQHAAHVELTNLRSLRLARARDSREKRARRLAAITAQLRDAVRMART